MKKMPLFLASMALTLGLSAMAAAAEVKNPDTFVLLTTGAPRTLDPAFCYDSASGEIITQIYDGLIMPDGTSTDDFLPSLSTKVPSVENGLISKDGKTYTFPIRKGVKFHNGDTLTPADVEYTFERGLMMNIADGPFSLFLEPLLGTQSIKQIVDPSGKLDDIKKAPAATLKAAYDKVDKAVEVDGDNVVFKLSYPFPAFLQLVSSSGSWASIVDKKWVAGKGGWDGKGDTWIKWYDQETDKGTMFDEANGTGPYMLKKWDRNGNQVLLQRHDEYWRGPAKIKNVTVRVVADFPTRKLQLQNGDADAINLPTSYVSQVEGMDGVVVKRKLISNSNVFFVFNQQVEAAGGNEWIGSGKLDGKGVPANFFSDINVRRAFQYIINYDALIKDVINGEAAQAYGPIPFNFKYVDKDIKKFGYDLKTAEKWLRKAFDGELWKKGFEMTLTYNTGNPMRQTILEMMQDSLRRINPKFKLEVRGIAWATLLDLRSQGRLPGYVMGWHADFTDPHNFAFPLLHSEGDYIKFAGRPAIAVAKKQFDPLINEAIREFDPVKRKALYKEIQEKFQTYVPLVVVYDSYNVRAYRDWVKGFKYNPARTGEAYYFYDLDK